MIGGLQGEFGDLDNKYLKKNIPKYLKMSVENIRKLQENTVALYTKRKTLRVSVIRRSGYVYPEKLKRPHLPSGCEISGCKMSAHGIPDVKCRRTEFLPGWTELCYARETVCVCKVQGPIQLNSIRIPQEDMRRHAIRRNFIRIPSEGHVACSPIWTCEHHTWTIAYPVRICCPDH